MADEKPPKFEDTEPVFDETIPLEEEVSLPAMPLGPSRTESFIRGASQGATLGHADELGAAIGAGLEKSFGPDEGKSLSDLYQEYLKLNRKDYQAAEEANPTSSMIGNIAGGFAIPVAGGLGKGASLGAKALNAAKVGAAAGAIAGEGASEAPLLSPEAAKAAIEGAGTGAALGAATPMLLAGASKAAQKTASGLKTAKDILTPELLGEMSSAYRLGRKGDLLLGKEAAKKTGDELISLSRKVPDILDTELNKLGKLQSQILKVSENKLDKKIDVQPALEKLQDDINNIVGLDDVTIREKDRLQGLLDRVKEHFKPEEAPLTPTKADELQDLIGKLSRMGDNRLTDPDVQAAATKGTLGVRDALRSEVPLMTAVDKRISAAKTAQEMLGASSEDLRDPNSVMFKMADLMSRMDNKAASGAKARANFQDFINQVKIANPSIGHQLESKMQQAAEKFHVTGAAQKEIYIPRPLSTARALAAKSGNIAGYTAHSLTPEWLSSVAGQLSQSTSQAARSVGKVLTDAAQKDEKSRNAIMFGLMQNPAYREILNPHLPKDDEEPTP